ncbi:MAG TPA: VWA domain-containing protein [Bryobacteraceae bacterium]|jgi:VWFA-related protein|nr:VWA domain-containing protein [Bryobacteraceae bacterium]
MGTPLSPLRRRDFLLSAVALAAGARARAQEPDGVTFSAGIKVVNVIASVRTKEGAIVRDLDKSDFTILENGRPQSIRYFARETDLPLTIGLLVDTSMSQQRVLAAERGASLRFLDEVLREEKDHVFLMQFDMVVQTRQELTSSRSRLDEALDYVDTPSRQELRMQSGGGTLLYDAVTKSSEEVMSKQGGRKALILLTDGGENGSEATLDDAIHAAQRADTLIYSIYFSDSGFYMGGGIDGRKILMRMSRETGGGFFEVSKKRSIDQIFSQIEEEIRSQYSIGYVSDVPVRVSEFRKLQLITDRKGLAVQARGEYWAKR